MRAARCGLAGLLLWCSTAAPAAPGGMEFVNRQIAAHPGQSGAVVLERGESSLVARAWLVDHARQSIDVQYFIWSTDNIGILAAEALLRAADRGVRVRVLVDDLLIDAPDESLLALARHPWIDIRIYNANLSVGVPLQRRLFNVLTDFRGINQRMHNKTLVVDGKLGITGGRNMAAEYYDFNHEYNFRDRDVLVAGPVVAAMTASFDEFWKSDLSAPVEELYDGFGLMRKNVAVHDQGVQEVYAALHRYADDPANFAPEVRAAIAAAAAQFPRLAREARWGRVEFFSDSPGKNDRRFGLGGGGRTTEVLADLARQAQERITIQSPYLVLSSRALALFRELRGRGVRVMISTNSLASTDNVPAFSGYRSQRAELLRLGVEIFEYRPDAPRQRAAMRTAPATGPEPPVCALHAKSLVVDSRVAWIGTFNLDPRSENLNTEAGVIVHDAKLARAVELEIEADAAAGNSWNAATDDPDSQVALLKRGKTRLLQLLPLRPLL